jgi:hypothetical protein
MMHEDWKGVQIVSEEDVPYRASFISRGKIEVVCSAPLLFLEVVVKIPNP